MRCVSVSNYGINALLKSTEMEIMSVVLSFEMGVL